MTERKLDNLVVPFTTILEILFGSNFSWVSLWRERLISVSATVFAFLENHNVNTIIVPAIKSKIGSAGTFLSNTAIDIVLSIPA